MAPLIVITGPTASGKSGLAMELAEKFGGEIVCADSRTIYKGMDIGTAKPTQEERERVPHHLLDVVEPGEKYTVVDFQHQAYQAIRDIRGRGKIPFLVGGTGLYIDSVVLKYTFAKDLNVLGQRNNPATLMRKTTGELQEMIKKQQLEMPNNLKNKRHLISTLTRGDKKATRAARPDDATIVVSITTPKEILYERIRQRATDMFSSGVIEEAKKLGEKYGWESEAMTGNIYPIMRSFIEGRRTEREAMEDFIASDRQLVKKQLTWLRRHDFVRWLSIDEARIYLTELLASR